jgi:hypothetical protein
MQKAIPEIGQSNILLTFNTILLNFALNKKLIGFKSLIATFAAQEGRRSLQVERLL